MIWHEPRNHEDDFYFCSCNIQGYNTKNKNYISYLNLQSAILPVPHQSDVLVLNPPNTFAIIISNSKFEYKGKDVGWTYAFQPKWTEQFSEKCKASKRFLWDFRLKTLCKTLTISRDIMLLLSKLWKRIHLIFFSIFFRFSNNMPKLIQMLGTVTYNPYERI